MQRLLLLLFFLNAGLIGQAWGQTFPAQGKVDSLLSRFLKKSGGTGISIALVDGDSVRYYSAGHTSRARQRASDENTVYEIASVTKVFTATAYAWLIEKGKIREDATLQSLLPDGLKAPVWEDNTPVLLTQLASHTSGFPRLPDKMYLQLLSHDKDEKIHGLELAAGTFLDPLNPNVGLLWKTEVFSRDPYRFYSAPHLWEGISKTKLERKPGSGYEYSNYAYGTLGFLSACEAGCSFPRLLDTVLLHPLKMRSTRLEIPDTTACFAQGHDADTCSPPSPHWHFETLAGGGALRSSTRDMARFLRLQIAPEKAGDPALARAIARTRIPQAKTDDRTSVGLAWHITPHQNDTLYWHNGRTAGFTSFAGVLKNSKRGIVILNNSFTVVDRLAQQILKVWPQETTLLPDGTENR